MKQNYPLELVATLLAKGVHPSAPRGVAGSMRSFLKGYFKSTKLVSLPDVIARSKREIQALQKFPFYVVDVEVIDGEHEYSRPKFVHAASATEAELAVGSDFSPECFEVLESGAFQEKHGYRIYTIGRAREITCISDLMGELSL